MRISPGRLATAATIAVALVLCAAFSGAGAAGTVTRGVPAATPQWLARMIHEEETSFGDVHPDTIVVRLGIASRYGRVLDRVWMRGDFSCGSCTTSLGSAAWRGRVIGFTVVARTHSLLSFSIDHG